MDKNNLDKRDFIDAITHALDSASVDFMSAYYSGNTVIVTCHDDDEGVLFDIAFKVTDISVLGVKY